MPKMPNSWTAINSDFGLRSSGPHRHAAECKPFIYRMFGVLHTVAESAAQHSTDRAEWAPARF